jgi:hypothetical protein
MVVASILQSCCEMIVFMTAMSLLEYKRVLWQATNTPCMRSSQFVACGLWLREQSHVLARER